MLAILFQVAYLLLYAFVLVLFTRFALSMVLSFGRRWRPRRGAAAAMEVVWSVTDPPLKALRRVIPSVRVGTVSLDLSSFVLLILVFVLLNFVLVDLIRWAASPS